MVITAGGGSLAWREGVGGSGGGGGEILSQSEGWRCSTDRGVQEGGREQCFASCGVARPPSRRTLTALKYKNKMAPTPPFHLAPLTTAPCCTSRGASTNLKETDNKKDADNGVIYLAVTQGCDNSKQDQECTVPHLILATFLPKAKTRRNENDKAH